MSLTPSLEENTTVLFFWERSFDGADSVPWRQFQGEFLSQYGHELDKHYDKTEQDWMLEILFKELVHDDDATSGSYDQDDVEKKGDQLVLKSKYEEYCKVDGVMHPFWMRLQDQAMEKLAMKAVFGSDSEAPIRLKAIENLAKFKSVAVFDALVELLEDEDPNARAIAAISVAKICGEDAAHVDDGGRKSSCDEVDEALLKLLLEDKDRLVRESVCIAFAYRKNHSMSPHLVHVWRNDHISSVRDAAHTALMRLGGADAASTMQTTNILQEEMKFLMESHA